MQTYKWSYLTNATVTKINPQNQKQIFFSGDSLMAFIYQEL